MEDEEEEEEEVKEMEEEEEEEIFNPKSSSYSYHPPSNLPTSSSCICPTGGIEPSCYQHGSPDCHSSSSPNPTPLPSSSSTATSNTSSKKKKVVGKVPDWQISLPHNEVKQALEAAKEQKMRITYIDPGLTKFAQAMVAEEEEEEKFYQWGGGDVLHERSPNRDFYKVLKFVVISPNE